MRKIFRVAITSGDVEGIGPEITAKALCKVRPQENVQFYLWRSSQFGKKYLKIIDRYFKRVTVSHWPEALKVRSDHYKTLIDINSVLPPALWVEKVGRIGLCQGIDALVTAPLSKVGIQNCGLKDAGHTGILKRVTKVPNVYMVFLGKKFNVVLLTGHISIKKAYEQITPSLLENCITLSQGLKNILPASQRLKPLGVVGCNPHSGEEGFIDSKEVEVYKPVIKNSNDKGVLIRGPLVPDVCFKKVHWKKYSFYIAAYHDQGLIPFKMAHKWDSGIQVSLGLPFIRTSVSHGTAVDIFGKNCADEGSMRKALEVALGLLQKKITKW